MRKFLYILIFFIPLLISANNSHIIFVVDGSGSMDGKPLQQAKDAMLKLARQLMLNGSQVAVIVGSDSCNGGTRINSKFVTNLKELKNIINQIKPTSGDNITLGFKYAQERMYKNNYDGHIYMFGDCDGLNYCESIESQAKKLAKSGKLTPFSYLFVEGCTNEEKDSWKKMVAKIGKASAGAASIFDYGKITQRKRKLVIHKTYFKKPKYLNKDGSLNSGQNYNSNPWRCIKSDGLLWLVITKSEQDYDFFMEEPDTELFYDKKDKNILIKDFIDILNSNNVCGDNKWRLPDIYELTRLTQMSQSRRAVMFPYLKMWPHISISGGDYTGYRKGVDFNNGNIYDYKEDRPYAAIFVSGTLDKTIFTVPTAMLERHKITRKVIINKTKRIDDDIIDDVYLSEKVNVKPNSLILSDKFKITGINVPVKAIVKNGEIKINNGNWQSGTVMLKNGDNAQLRHKSSPNYSSTNITQLIVGSKLIEFKSKTILRSTAPVKNNSCSDREASLGLCNNNYRKNVTSKNCSPLDFTNGTCK